MNIHKPSSALLLHNGAFSATHTHTHTAVVCLPSSQDVLSFEQHLVFVFLAEVASRLSIGP